jgi:hypothetical protein
MTFYGRQTGLNHSGLRPGKTVVRLFSMLLLAQISFFFPAADCPALDKPKTLIVSGVRDETGDPAWNDQLIAVGISDLVAEELFATGRFIPLEDDPEITARIQELVAASWTAGDDDRQVELMQEARHIGSEAVAYGVVKNFRKKRRRTRAGPFSSSKVTISFDIELFIEEQGQPVRSAVGTGKGVTRAKGVLIRVREDKIRFDKTTVGSAAQQAVHEAVKKLFPE